MACGGPASREELWRECASWLTRCEVLRADHKANWPNATIVDLAYILRDGVLLCNLLNTLDPGCIDTKEVNHKPQMAQFLCMRNIQIFLDSCKKFFSIPDTDLFDAVMLFELTNFHRVLYTLSKLSNCPKAKRKNILGFSVHKNSSKEDIYQSLKSVGEPGGTCASASTPCSWMKFSIRCPRMLEQHCEEVYEDLCYVTFSPRAASSECMPSCDRDEPSAAHAQDEEHAEYATYYSRARTEEIYQDLCSVRQNLAAPPIEKRDHVIKELLDTEKNYVEVLKTLNIGFMKPLSYYLSPESLSRIFKDIPELLSIHSEFYRQLQAFHSEDKARLSTTFLNFRERFLVYGSYCANLTEAQALLQDECDQNEIFNQEVNRCQLDANNGKFKLRDVLSVPMQRILKYHLLLGKLIEETSRTHEDYNGLKRAREAMLDVATYINEVKRDSDHLVLLKQVKDNISDWTMPLETSLYMYGHLLKDGELKIKSHDDQKIHMRYVFIFEKIMVLCKSMRGNQFSFKEYLQLQEFEMEDVTMRPVLTRDARWSYQWLLVKKNRQTVYTLYARTVDLKRKMMKAMQEALDSLEPASCRKTQHKFVMHTFEKPISCNRCSKFLKGLIHQGYRCRACDIAVHRDCIASSGKCCPGGGGGGAGGGQGAGPGTGGGGPLAHVDEQLKEHLWFAGAMEREEATRELEHKQLGTYLLRVRPQDEEARYALSLKTERSVRHMRVFYKRVDDTDQFYLSDARYFKSVFELVNFYEKTSLKENYERLSESARLLWSYRAFSAEATADWRPHDGDAGQIPLRLGCRVVVLDMPDSDSWWKGLALQRVGYFPKHYVRIIQQINDFHL